MPIIALLAGNSIDNIIVCDTEEFAKILWPMYNCVNISEDSPQPSIGWIRTETGWIEPPVSGSTPTSGSI
jgi:hypothetical protein